MTAPLAAHERFSLLEELGRGGMGVVYKAHQRDLDRVVAIKVLAPALAHDTTFRARFLEEAQHAARLDHSNIVPIYEVGELQVPDLAPQPLPFFAMKYLPGETLRECIHRQGALPPDEAVDLLEPIASALDEAHRRGMIHRDIKPGNIIIAPNGHIWLTDFGLARNLGDVRGLTITGMLLGTPEYMAPEQAQGRSSTSPASDLYSLGIVLFEALTGQLPFESDTPIGALAARLTQPPRRLQAVRPDLPLELDSVLRRALEREPEGRFPTATTLIASARQAIQHTGATVASRDVRPFERAPRREALPVETLRLAAGPQPYDPQPLVASPTILPQGPLRRTLRHMWLLWAGMGLLLTSALMAGRILAAPPLPVPIGITLPDLPDQPLIPAPPAPQILSPEVLATVDRQLESALDALSRGRPLDAELIARNALVVLNDSAPVQVARAQGILSWALYEQGRAEEAKTSANSAIFADASQSIGYITRSREVAREAAEQHNASLLVTVEQDIQQAKDRARNAGARYLALVEVAQADLLTARAQISDNLEERQNLLNESIAARRRAVETYGTSSYVQASLGYAYIELANSLDQLPGLQEDQYERAGQIFERARAQDTSSSLGLSGLGWVAYYQKKDDAARTYFDQAISRNPQDVQAWQGKSRVLLQNASASPPDYKASLDVLNAALQTNANTVVLWNDLGWAYLARTQDKRFAVSATDRDISYARAQEAFKHALDRSPQSLQALLGMGYALQYEAKNEDSIVYFERILSRNEHSAEAHNGLGWSLLNVERTAEAQSHFERALAIDPLYRSAQDGLDTLRQ